MLVDIQERFLIILFYLLSTSLLLDNLNLLELVANDKEREVLFVCSVHLFVCLLFRLASWSRFVYLLLLSLFCFCFCFCFCFALLFHF